MVACAWSGTEPVALATQMMMNDCVTAALDCQMGCVVGRQAQVVAPADENACDCWHLPTATRPAPR